MELHSGAFEWKKKNNKGPTAEEIRITKEIKKGKTGYTAGRKDENSMEWHSKDR